MRYKNIEFEAIVATPGCGKSYLCDKYPNRFVDVDEERLRCKYCVPKDATREELERTKGHRPYPRRFHGDEYINELNKVLDRLVANGKILICAPHPEAIDYLVKNNIKFAFVYQNKYMKDELIKRMKIRGNSEATIAELTDQFDYFYNKNINENQSAVKYEFGPDEYLEDILKKFGCNF